MRVSYGYGPDVPVLVVVRYVLDGVARLHACYPGAAEKDGTLAAVRREFEQEFPQARVVDVELWTGRQRA